MSFSFPIKVGIYLGFNFALFTMKSHRSEVTCEGDLAKIAAIQSQN